jgi:hypothetical protein
MKKFLSILFIFSIVTSSIAEYGVKSIRVFVALCDNKTQGIVPVSAKLGNGDDLANNLYWGALYGVKAFLKRSKYWTLLKDVKNPQKNILERVVFKHKSTGAMLTADAYRGAAIKQAMQDFLKAAAAKDKTKIVVYIGHNGLMDFRLPLLATPTPNNGKTAIVLCCKSKQYFLPYLKQCGVYKSLLTTNFMAPEAYVLDAAVRSLLLGGSIETTRKCVAKAYSKYQKCSLSAADRLFDQVFYKSN